MHKLRGLILILIVECVSLGYMCYERESVLQSGETVLIKTVPVDPRDVFRGEYVALQYDISGISAEMADKNFIEEMKKPEKRVYLIYSVNPKNCLVPELLTMNKPVNKKFIRGFTRRNWGGPEVLHVRYGIERFYTEQYKARNIESGKRTGGVRIPMLMEVAIGKENGIGVVKGYRFSDLGMGIEFPGNKPGKNNPPSIKIKIANDSKEDFAIIDNPDHPCFKFEIHSNTGPENRKKNTAYVSSDIKSGPFTDRDVIKLPPGEVYEFTLELTGPGYQLYRNNEKIPWDSLDWGEEARLIYASPDAKEMGSLKDQGTVWQGELVSEPIHGFNFKNRN